MILIKKRRLRWQELLLALCHRVDHISESNPMCCSIVIPEICPFWCSGLPLRWIPAKQTRGSCNILLATWCFQVCCRLAERPKALAVHPELLSTGCHVIADNTHPHIERHFRHDKQDQRFTGHLPAPGVVYRMQFPLSACRELFSFRAVECLSCVTFFHPFCSSLHRLVSHSNHNTAGVIPTHPSASCGVYRKHCSTNGYWSVANT